MNCDQNFPVSRATTPTKVWFEKSVSCWLRDMLQQNAAEFELAANPGDADVILFDCDLPDHIRKTNEFRQWPVKCFVVSDTDQPTYFLPACYASNRRTWLGRGRSQTMPYFVAQRANPNSFIEPPDWDKPRPYLYSFLGGSTSWIRKKLFRLAFRSPDVLVESTDYYEHWNGNPDYQARSQELRKRYANVLQQSRFCLCPRGAGISSIRLFEVMQAGVVPVIISDDWIPVPGVAWDKFALFLPEKSLGDLDAFVRAHSYLASEYGKRARQAWEDFCAPGVDAIMLRKLIAMLQQTRDGRRERWLHWLFPGLELVRDVKWQTRTVTRSLVLKAFTLTGRKFPYQLNRS